MNVVCVRMCVRYLCMYGIYGFMYACYVCMFRSVCELCMLYKMYIYVMYFLCVSYVRSLCMYVGYV